MKEIKDCGRLGEIAERVSQAVTAAVDGMLDEHPDLQIVFVIVPGGEVPGGAVMNARKVATNTLGDAVRQLEHTQKILRNGAESCGRGLWQSPGEPIDVAAETAFIVRESLDAFWDWDRRRCSHPGHAIREAATMVATGVRILTAAGAPAEAVHELTQMCKEVCRRAHLADLQRQAKTHAQA